MTRDLRLQMIEVYSDNLRACDPEDDRTPMSPATRRRMQERGLQWPLPEGPKAVICLDPILHTDACPLCEDMTCPCHLAMQEQIAQELAPKRRKRTIRATTSTEIQRNIAPINGNRPFNLMR